MGKAGNMFCVGGTGNNRHPHDPLPPPTGATDENAVLSLQGVYHRLGVSISLGQGFANVTKHHRQLIQLKPIDNGDAGLAQQ